MNIFATTTSAPTIDATSHVIHGGVKPTLFSAGVYLSLSFAPPVFILWGRRARLHARYDAGMGRPAENSRCAPP